MMYQPHEWYYTLPPALIRAARRTSVALGTITVVTGIALTVTIPVIGTHLPTSHVGGNVITVGMGTMTAVFALLSGMAMLVAQGAVSTGSVDRRAARAARGVPAGLLAGALIALVIFLLFHVTAVTSTWNRLPDDPPEVHFTPLITGYLMLPVLATALVVANLVAVQLMFYPNHRRIRKYAAMP